MNGQNWHNLEIGHLTSFHLMNRSLNKRASFYSSGYQAPPASWWERLMNVFATEKED